MLHWSPLFEPTNVTCYKIYYTPDVLQTAYLRTNVNVCMPTYCTQLSLQSTDLCMYVRTYTYTQYNSSVIPILRTYVHTWSTRAESLVLHTYSTYARMCVFPTGHFDVSHTYVLFLTVNSTLRSCIPIVHNYSVQSPMQLAPA